MNRNSKHARHFQKLSLVAGLFAIVLAGCTTLTPEQQRAADEKICLNYGFKPKTDAMANCLLQTHLDRRADIRAWQNERPQYITPPVIYQPVIIRK